MSSPGLSVCFHVLPVGYVDLMHASVTLPTRNYPFLKRFSTRSGE